jgi:hypothetical protein
MRRPEFASALSSSQWDRAYFKLGPDVEAIVRDNPYVLSRELKIKIETVDKVAAALRIPKTDPRRCVAVASDVLDQAARGGDCYVLLHTISYAAGFANQAACAEALVAADLAVVEADRYVYPRKLHAAETHIAAWLKSRLRGDDWAPTVDAEGRHNGEASR